jgi:spermidine synthase
LARPWQTLESAETADGELKLLRRGADDFLITLDGRVLMNSQANRSELAVAELACQAVAGVERPRVLIGGLGMGCSVRAALDALPADAKLTVAELHRAVARWCTGPLAEVNRKALADSRVELVIDDVAKQIRLVALDSDSPRYHAIILDLFEGPHAHTDPVADPFYGEGALGHTWDALDPRGIFAVWSEDRDAGFERRLQRVGFDVERRRPGRGGRRHAVYLARRGATRR